MLPHQQSFVFADPISPNGELKVATWNVNGIRARQAQFLEWVERDQPDIICLQEIKATEAQIITTIRELPGYWSYWHGSGAYSGVSMHVRAESFSREPQFTHPHFDRETRIVQANLGHLVIASVYIPNGNRDYAGKIEFLKAMEGYVAETLAVGLALIVCGDMNVARTEQDVHPRERKPNKIGQLPEERELLERIIGLGLVDLGRAFDPDNDRLFTWWAPWREMRQRNIGWRLDYILASESLAKKATACVVLPEVGTSDHGPVMATFDLASQPEADTAL